MAGPIIVDGRLRIFLLHVEPILLGAKRDRAVWPGDMGIAVPAQFVSTFDLIPTRNALATMFAAIDPKTGALPESGPPLSQKGSDTYHAWTLIGTRKQSRRLLRDTIVLNRTLRQLFLVFWRHRVVGDCLDELHACSSLSGS